MSKVQRKKKKVGIKKVPNYLEFLQKQCHKIAKEKGFWDDWSITLEPNKTVYGITDLKYRNNGELIALMHSELSEALEAIRHDDWKNVGEEMADTVIRILDFCEARGINLSKEIVKKMKINRKREYKHGKKF